MVLRLERALGETKKEYYYTSSQMISCLEKENKTRNSESNPEMKKIRN